MISHFDLKLSDEDVRHPFLDSGHNIFKTVQIARNSDTGHAVLARYSHSTNKVGADVVLPQANGSHASNCFWCFANITTIVCCDDGLLQRQGTRSICSGNFSTRMTNNCGWSYTPSSQEVDQSYL